MSSGKQRGLGLGRRADPAEVRKLRLSLPLRQLALGGAKKLMTPRTSRYWYDGTWWLDQRSSPHCVGYAWLHILTNGPVHQLEADKLIRTIGGETALKKAEEAADKLYRDAQKIDEWPGESYDGTSVRAGSQVLRNHGIFEQSTWAMGLADVIDCVLQRGPVVVGCNWYEGMFNPDSKGRIYITGQLIGGHAFVINGVNTKTRMFRMKNSWGRKWGIKGRAYIPFHELERLLREDGEAVFIMEKQAIPPIIK